MNKKEERLSASRSGSDRRNIKKSNLSKEFPKENAEKAIQYIHEANKKINWVLEDAEVQETVKISLPVH